MNLPKTAVFRLNFVSTILATTFFSSLGVAPTLAQVPTIGDDLLSISTYDFQTIDALTGFDTLDYSTLTDGNVFVHFLPSHTTVGKAANDGSLSGVDTINGVELFKGTDVSGTSTFVIDGIAYDDVFGVDTIPDGVTIDGGAGNDVLLITNTNLFGFITLDETARTLTDNSTGNVLTYTNIESVTFTFLLGIQFGTPGDDSMLGSLGADQLYGSTGNDTLFGGAGYDELFGNQGFDTLIGESGNDSLYGGAGNDIYVAQRFDHVFQAFGDDVIVEEEGIDFLQIDNPFVSTPNGVTLLRDVDDLVVTVPGQGSVRIQDQYLGGGNSVEYIQFGDDGSVQILPGIDDIPYDPIANPDFLVTRRNTVLTGNLFTLNRNVTNSRVIVEKAAIDFDLNGDAISAQEQTIVLPSGEKLQIFNNGDFIFTPAQNQLGRVSFDYTLVDSSGRTDTATVSVEIGTFIATNDLASQLNSSCPVDEEGLRRCQFFFGREGDNEFAGLDGVDLMGGGQGDDFISGGKGDDLLFNRNFLSDVDLGADYFGGDEGNDTIRFNWRDSTTPSGFQLTHAGSPGVKGSGLVIDASGMDATHDLFDGGAGEDTLVIDQNAVSSSTPAVIGVLQLDNPALPTISGFASDTQRIRSVEIILGNNVKNVIDLTSRRFTYGDVTILAEGGNDVLWSNAGNDLLDGGSGNDILDGGAGTDTLIGGPGADSFYLGASDGSTDVITDFSVDENDVLAVYGFLLEFDDATMSLTDFVQFSDDGTDSSLLASLAGSGSDFVAVATLEGIIGLAGQEQSLFDADQLRLLFTGIVESGIAGDYNNDGIVDAADYTVWRDNVGADAGTLLNDTDGGVIDQDQYTTWSNNFGATGVATANGDTNSVPEPSTFVLFALAVFAWAAAKLRPAGMANTVGC